MISRYFLLFFYFIVVTSSFYPLQASKSLPYTLAFDVETSGSSFKQHALLSIGSSLQDQDSNELRCFQVNLAIPEDRRYDDHCLKSFWRQHPQAHAFVQNNCVSPQEGLQQFCHFLEDVEHHYRPLTLVSDNPSFDIAWLNLYLDLYTHRKPLNYDQSGAYRVISDSHSMQKMILMSKMDETELQRQGNLSEKLGFTSRWISDHNPLNDARVIADYYNQTLKFARMIYTSKQKKLKINPSILQRNFHSNVFCHTLSPSFFFTRKI